MANQGIRLVIVDFGVPKETFKELLHSRCVDSKFAGILSKLACGNWTALVSPSTNGGSAFKAFENELHCSVAFRCYLEQELLAVDIHEERHEGTPEMFTPSILEKLCSLITTELNCKLLRPAAIIPRGGIVNNQFFSSDQRLLVYDFDKVIVDVHSEFQHIQIFHSPQFGNTLVLDGYINLAENDLIYTHTFMRKGKDNYKGKEVLILGGGDGALLNEVLQEQPKFVTMVDIDHKVLEVCREHMRVCCGNALDSLDGANHKIIIGDCFPVINDFIAAGRKFDYVFSDLTDVPVVTEGETKHAEFWDLMIKILDKSTQLLSPSGKLLNHLTGICSKSVIEKYESILSSRNFSFEQSVVMVPSFLEPWVFYCIQKK